MNHAPSAGSIARLIDLQSSALPLSYGCLIDKYDFILQNNKASEIQCSYVQAYNKLKTTTGIKHICNKVINNNKRPTQVILVNTLNTYLAI